MTSKTTKKQNTKTSSKSTDPLELVSNVVSLQTANSIVENNLHDQTVELKNKNKKTKKAVPVKTEATTATLTTTTTPTPTTLTPETTLTTTLTTTPVVKATKKKAKTDVEQVVEQVVEQPVAQPVAELELMAEPTSGNNLRYFKLFYNDKIQGRYCGKKPKQAANKAFSSIIKEFNKTNKDNVVNTDITFSIKECTRYSKHKEYMYLGKRLLLENPVKVSIANQDGTVKEIEYKFHNKLQKAQKLELVK